MNVRSELMTLSEVCRWLSVPLPYDDRRITGVCTGSRQVYPGDLFIAVQGDTYDGHDFVEQAIQRGACAAVVQRPVRCRGPLLQVKDTVLALGEVAKQWRHCFDLPVIAVVGSNGKTTVKEMIAAILRQAHPNNVLATEGNQNNAIGVPLTLLRLQSHHRVVVVEIGANHPGEIAALAGLVSPTSAVVTNSGFDHLAGFGSRQGAALANAELFDFMPDQSPVFLNAEDEYLAVWEARCHQLAPQLFSLDSSSTPIHGHWLPTPFGHRMNIQSPWGACDFALPQPGRHNALNALSAFAVTAALGCSSAQIQAGFNAFVAPKGRLNSLSGVHGYRIIDDSYNANPSSLNEALDVLKTQSGIRILVLGEMGELGGGGPHWHQQAGIRAKSLGIDWLFAWGELARYAAEAFGEQGVYFTHVDALIEALHNRLDSQCCVLVKGSRHMRLEQVVDAIRQQSPTMTTSRALA